MTAVPLSVLIPTLNEDVNLPDCLASVAFADEVVVVDSFSSDRTVEVARAARATVVQHRFESYSRQKNWALTEVPWRNAWVLIVDADERVTPELQAELTAFFGPAGAADGPLAGYYVNRKFIFLGRWIQHAGWYPSWNLRLFRHARGRYDDRDVHEHLVLDGPHGFLREDLLHDDQRGLEAYVARHNRYSTLEAQARRKAELNAPDRARLPLSVMASPVQRKRFVRERIWPRVPGKPLALFVYMYLVRRGFLDGAPGLALCVFHAFQEFMVGLKLAEVRRLSSRRA